MDGRRGGPHEGHRFAARPPQRDEARRGDGPRMAGPQSGRRPIGPPMAQFQPGRIIARMTAALDSDKDGKVSMDEFNSGQKKRFEELDTNKDGSVDTAEIRAAAQKMTQRIQNAAGRQGPPRDGAGSHRQRPGREDGPPRHRPGRGHGPEKSPPAGDSGSATDSVETPVLDA